VSSLDERTRAEIASVLAGRPDVARALIPPGGPKPTIAFEYDERPATVEEASRRVEELVSAVAPILGSRAREFGFAAGGPEEIARLAAGADVLYERP